ncbi:MAG: flagellar basal body L-ring protein FlgH [Gemmatimonadales bacterium]
MKAQMMGWLALAMVAPTMSAAAQQVAPPPAAPGAAPAAVDTTTRRASMRANWLTDRRPLHVGDILALIVDEQATAREQSSTTARNTRDQSGAWDMQSAPSILKSLGISYASHSDQGGVANRSGGLSTVLSVRVTAIDPSGVAHIEGHKLLAIDGRNQEVSIAGLIRPEDVSAGNTILSSRIADASISYKGKKISPKTGIIGKILGMLWP